MVLGMMGLHIFAWCASDMIPSLLLSIAEDVYFNANEDDINLRAFRLQISKTFVPASAALLLSIPYSFLQLTNRLEALYISLTIYTPVSHRTATHLTDAATPEYSLSSHSYHKPIWQVNDAI